MNFLRGMAIICLWAITLPAQSLIIRGVVIDEAGTGIAGATVGLEVEKIFTATGEDGRFTLTNGVAIKNGTSSPTACDIPISIHHGDMTITLFEKTNVVMSVHDITGRQLYKSSEMYGSGIHSLPVPVHSTGMYLYRVEAGGRVFLFKSSPFGTALSMKSNARSSRPSRLEKTTGSIDDMFNDIFYVNKEGYLDHIDSMFTLFSDSSGMVVKMITNAGNVTCNDGTVYPSVKIGNQVWTVGNLRVTTLNDGTPIANITDSTEWVATSTPGYSYYGNSTNTAFQKHWGALYNWYTIGTGKLAPEGWRVPTAEDWSILIEYMIDNGYNWNRIGGENRIAKSLSARTNWLPYNKRGVTGYDMHANNSSGFSALPGGLRIDTADSSFYNSFDYGKSGGFETIPCNGYWWSSTATSADAASCVSLYHDREYMVNAYSATKNKGLAVRLVRDLQ